jgi:hypothetical protein
VLFENGYLIRERIDHLIQLVSHINLGLLDMDAPSHSHVYDLVLQFQFPRERAAILSLKLVNRLRALLEQSLLLLAKFLDGAVTDGEDDAHV